METSLNGWPTIQTAAGTVTVKVPGTSHTIRGAKDVVLVLAAFLADWNRLMPARLKLTDAQDVACWNYRKARAANGYSNHASGTAVDACNNTVLKADNKAHMTANERNILKGILAQYVTDDGHHILANGYAWGSCDEMHTELSQAWDHANGAKRDTTRADVLNVIKRLKIDGKGNRPLAL